PASYRAAPPRVGANHYRSTAGPAQTAAPRPGRSYAPGARLGSAGGRMSHRLRTLVAASAAAVLAVMFAPTATQAALLGNQLKIVTATANIITGTSWSLTAEVDDFLGNPVSGATVWVGTKEPSTGCGSDLTVTACTSLATTQDTADGNGRLTLEKPAALDTFVVLYLSDSQGALDPTTGQSVLS